MTGGGGRREDGFAIILVLWLLVALSAIAIHLAATGRSEVHVAANTLAAAQAEALADAGVAEAVFGLSDPDASRRWPADGQPRDIAFSDGRVRVRVSDENAKLNPNLAPDKLVAAFFRRSGASEEVAASLAAAISVRVRPNPYLRPPSDSASPGAAATPVPAPFDTLDEMMELPGMTADLLAASRPHLSVYATTAVPTRATTDPLVAAAVGDFQALSSNASPGDANGATGKATVWISSTARSRRGGLFVRDAIVRLDPTAPAGYVTLRWARGQPGADPSRSLAVLLRD